MGNRTEGREIVFVTGGTSGIGLGIAEKFLDSGFEVIINYYNDERRAARILRSLRSRGYEEGRDVRLCCADISDEWRFARAGRSLRPLLGRISVLVNNAGILKRGSMFRLKQEDWERIFGVNVFGLVNVSRWFAAECRKARCIVNVGSVRGIPHMSRPGNSIYSVSKACVPVLTALQAKELGPRVRVNSIIPGPIDTPQRQGVTRREAGAAIRNAVIRRLGRVEEVADLCLYLASEDASFITGADFLIDGGQSINSIR